MGSRIRMIRACHSPHFKVSSFPLTGMAQMTEEMITAFRSGRIFPFATASTGGEPNVAPMGAVFVRDPGTIWIGDQFMKATISNVIENPRACLYVWGPGIKGCYKVKGDITVKKSGKEYETMREEVAKAKPGLKCRSLLVMKVTEVYGCMPGEGAGDRLI